MCVRVCERHTFTELELSLPLDVCTERMEKAWECPLIDLSERPMRLELDM